METQASNNAAKWNARLYENDRRQALAEAENAEVRGHQQASAFEEKIRGAVGSIKARSAASGLGPGGSVGEAIRTTTISGDVGRTRIQYNAAREAWAARMQAENLRMLASLEKMKKRNPWVSGYAGLISGAGPTLSAWDSYAKQKQQE